ncbi:MULTISPECIES: hypothetical protein [Sphingobacterium]|nr:MULTISPECIES: hypothetical protein [Sphingobacterium]MCW2261300.1 hypothetical protein [Sphingobacterium kitahiroshimense]TCR07775.1 hypothetical protein EDF67_10853 [Sphingobacterium sp. JUb78]
MILVSRFWTKVFSWGKADAITIYPFIFLKKRIFKDNRQLINHEQIHMRQAVELLIIFFYISYLIEFLFRYLQYRNFHQAYLNISYEREAYANEADFDYLSKRRFWAFLKYLKK